MMLIKRTPIQNILGPAAFRANGGFTILELLLVIVILSILVAIAVPAYLGFRTSAADAAVKANLRSVVSAANAFAIDNTGAKGDADNKANTSGYKGMSVAILNSSYDAGIAPSVTVVSNKTTAVQFCVTDAENGRTWSLLGPALTSSSWFNNAKCK